MKEEIVELIGADIEDGILVSYTGEQRNIVIPPEVRRIGSRAFSGTSVERIVVHGKVGSIESGAFSSCEHLREVRLENGVVKIADGVFSECPSLSLIAIPETVLIMDDGALPVGNEKLVVIARAGSFAYNYAVKHGISVFENEGDFTTLERQKEELTYTEFDIFGEKIKVSSSAPICYEIEEYYNSVAEEFLDALLSRYNSDEVFEKYISDTADRVNRNGVKVTTAEIISLLSDDIACLKHEYRGYRIVARGELSSEGDIERAREIFVEKVEQFLDALKSVEIKCLARDFIVHGDTIPLGDKRKAREISDNIISSGECSEVSVALSLKLYPYNTALIVYAVRSGVFCDDLMSLARLLGVNFFADFEETINKLLDKRGLFDVKDINNFVKGTLDATLPEYIWGALARCDIYPSFDGFAFLEGCRTFDEVADALIEKITKIKAELDEEYKRANEALAGANSVTALESALKLFEDMSDYKDSNKKAKEIKDRIEKSKRKRKRNQILTIVASSFVVFAVLLTVLIVYLSGPRFEFVENDDGGYTLVGANKNKAELNIPKTHRGKLVTAIGDNAFKGFESLTSITIPESVTSIGDSAFYSCSKLTSVIIPGSVTKIGNLTFYSCSKLTSVTIPEGVTSIGYQAFDYCTSLAEINYRGTEAQWNEIVKSTRWDYNTGEYVVNYNYGSTVTEPEESGFTFELIGNGYKVTGYTGSDTEIVIPREHLGLPVTAIGEETFKDNTGLVSVVIPDSIIDIGRGAFAGCTSLVNITIPDSVVSIGYEAFASCDSLASVVIPDSVTNVEGYAFSDCKSLVSVTIGNGVTRIGVGVFSHCERLASVVIPDGVTVIDDSAFYRCQGLASVTIPKSVEAFGTGAFEDCTSLTTINYCGTEAEWNEIVKSTMWDYNTGEYVVIFGYDDVSDFTFELVGNEYKVTGYNGTDTEIVIPSQYNGKPVTSIGVFVFYQSTSLKSIVIPDTVTSIADNTFRNCQNLTSVTIGNGVTSIGDEAFYWCNSLKNVTIGNSVTSIGVGAFNYCDSLETITIPSSVTNIGDYAFSDCNSLISITISEATTSIGKGAFSSCLSLLSITIPEAVTSIGENAFYSCDKLVEVINKSDLDITAGSSDFGYVAYYAIEVHNGESKIVNQDDYLFYSYDGVNYLLGYAGNDTELTLPESNSGEEYEIYERAFVGCDDLESVIIPSGITSISKGAFFGCTSLKNVTIPDTVTSIGDEAFRICYSLASITIPSNITSIPSHAFHDCKKLVEVINKSDLDITTGSTNNGYVAYYAIEVHTGETKIVNQNGYLFYSYDGVNYLVGYVGNETELTLPESYDGEEYEIYENAFAYCYGLTSVIIPSGITSISNGAFFDCINLTSVTLPNTVTLIGDSAFNRCSSLKNITIPNGVTIIGNSAFHHCRSLTSITIPDSVTGIYSSAFSDCENLASVTIGKGVITIGEGAFTSCRNLTSITVDPDNANYSSIDGNLYNKNGTTLVLYAVGKTDTSFTIPDTVTSIGDYAFYYCQSLESVTIPDSVTDIGEYAFSGCSSLASIIIGKGVAVIDNYAFYYCKSLTEINYRGTEAEWNAITKGTDWDEYTGEYVVNYNYIEE